MNTPRSLPRTTIIGSAANLLLAGAAFAFYYVLIRPLSVSFINNTREVALLEERENTLLSTAREIEQRQNDLATLDAALLDLDNAVPFITVLEQVAREAGVSITLQTAPAKNTTDTQKTEFTISVAGTLARCMAFISKIELLPYFSDITSLNISTKEGAVQATLRLSILTN